MSELTKEWLLKTIAELEEERDAVPGVVNEDAAMSLAAMKIALASLEVEPVAYMYKDNLHADARFSLHTRFGNWSQEDINEYEITEIPLYAAPPAPVSDSLLSELLGIAKRAADEADECAHAEFSDDSMEYSAAIADWERRATRLQGAELVKAANKLPEETGSSLQLRNLIRQRHAEWSQATFDDVGPVGPLKHLSKEALEAAEEPDDLSEWADMQFLLWDAQRRAGISDGEITAAMEEKLKVNMARQWPEPKDGEPRMHIKAAPQQEVNNDQ